MCRVDDTDIPDCCWVEQRRARKEHRCGECMRTIQVGEVYTRCRAIHGGDTYIEKQCQHCSVAADWLVAHCGGFLFNEVQEDLEEHFLEGYRPDGLGRLLVGMRRKWRCLRKPDQLMPLPDAPSTPQTEAA